jgi:hypothetical protein
VARALGGNYFEFLLGRFTEPTALSIRTSGSTLVKKGGGHVGKDRRTAAEKAVSDARRPVVNKPRQVESLKVFQGGPRPRRLFFFTQPGWCVNWLNDRQFPQRWWSRVDHA